MACLRQQETTLVLVLVCQSDKNETLFLQTEELSRTGKIFSGIPPESIASATQVFISLSIEPTVKDLNCHLKALKIITEQVNEYSIISINQRLIMTENDFISYFVFDRGARGKGT